jgi:polysaccharide biosynthesis transport protein
MSPLQVLLILWRRFWIVALTFTSTVLGAAVIMKVVPPRYEAVATASIDPGQTDPVTGQPIAGGSMKLLQGNLVNLVKSHRVADMVVKRLNLLADPVLISKFQASNALGQVDMKEWVAAGLLVGVDASFPEGTNVLTIKYKSDTAISAAQIANAFLAAFIDAAVEMKIDAAQQTAQWFEPQTAKLRADLAAAREKLAKFQRDAQLLAAGAAGDTENDQLVSVTNELSNTKAQLLKLESQQATAAIPAAGMNQVQAFDSPLITTLKGQLAAVEAEIGKLRSEVGTNNPKLMALVASRKSLQEVLRTEIGNNREELTTRIKALKEQVGFLEKARSVQLRKMIDVQAQRDQLNTLKRDVEFRVEQLQTAAKSADTSRMQSQLSLSNISPLDVATRPLSPAFPKAIPVMVAGVGAGLCLGVIFGLLAEAFDRRVRVTSDLQFAGQTVVLGTLLQGAPGRRHRLFAKRRKRASPPTRSISSSLVHTRTR